MADRDPMPDWIQEHIDLYKRDPKAGHDWRPGVPTLLLTTTGRKSGQPLLLPLIYGKSGDSYVVVASKGGAPEHPDWYLNLEANPTVEVQVAEDKWTGKARTANAQEKPALWEQMAKIWPDYNNYQSQTDREIPVVILEKQ